jgi:quinol---cytochrome c reductase iron-sulfur subunit, bacillus type
MPTTPPETATAPVSSDQPSSPPRRSFLAALLGAGSAGVGALLAIPVVRFIVHPLLASTTEKSWSEVGKVDEFQSITAPVKKVVQFEQRDGWRRLMSEKPVYVVKDAGGQLAVLSAVCTHLGCTVPWLADQEKFICPCHKGTFDPTGKVIGGPAPRNMDALPMKIEDGVLKVQYEFFRQLSPHKEVIA